MNRRTRRSLVLAAAMSSIFVLPRIADATIVEFQTVMGDFEVNLYDNATPETVANFLDYINNGSYNGSILHRSIANFIVQGGGFSFNTLTGQIDMIAANAAVVNEPEFANVRGTIAMAKQAGNPNSATNQWFFNLADNTANLDTQNGGFTAFGEVVGNGMDVVDAIAALQTFDLGGALSETPLRGDTTNNPLDDTNYIIVTAVIISDSTVDSAGAAGLNPTPTTANPGGGGTVPPATGGGGGTFGILGLFGLLLAYRFKR